MVRFRVNGKRCHFTATTAAEALATKKRIESEQHHSLFVDYTKAHQTKFSDLLVRYLHEEAPRKKGFLVLAYQINKLLEDAGLPRQDIAAIHFAHPNPQASSLHIPKPTGRRMSPPSESASFIRSPFASLKPEDFREYMDERLQTASPATVDRELDVFRAVCTTAVDIWRIHVHIDPMKGVQRPSYFNERDRRLRGNEEARLMSAAQKEDRRWSTKVLGNQLFAQASASTKYQRLKSLKEARQTLVDTQLAPVFSTFLQFQLMTGARLGETLKLRWDQLQLDQQTAFLPETKNGRARALSLRSGLVELLRTLPQNTEHVFPVPKDYLRKAWKRMCAAADIPAEGLDSLRIHDLRHEAISRVAEASSQLPGGFSLLDLQAFSGHRDPRMLMRYTHLTPTGLAKRLDAAFAKPENVTLHRGRRRLTEAAELPIAEIMSTPLSPEAPPPSNVVSLSMYRKAAA
jgi:integrase